MKSNIPVSQYIYRTIVKSCVTQHYVTGPIRLCLHHNPLLEPIISSYALVQIS